MNEQEMAVNEYYRRVKKCCASCQHKDINIFGVRHCLLTGRRIRAKKVCDCWIMSNQLAQLGMETGGIKCRAYQLHMMSVRVEEAEMMGADTEVTQASVEEIRKDYEEQYGSIYINF